MGRRGNLKTGKMNVDRCKYCGWPSNSRCCVKGMETKFDRMKDVFLMYIAASDALHQSPFDRIVLRKYSEAKREAFDLFGFDYE